MKLFRGLYLALAAALSISAGFAHAEVRFEDRGSFLSYLQRRNGPVVAVFPGAGIDASRYDGLVKELLAKDPAANVLVAKFTNNYANPLEAKSRLQSMMQHLGALGWQNPEKVTFLAGHSLGAIFAHGLAIESKLGGVILLGGYLPQSAIGGSPYTLATYPAPILVLGGDLDGRVGLWHQAREFKAYKAWEKDHPRDPSHLVITLSGVNHMEFADGHVLDGDIKANQTIEAAHQAIAEVVSLFVRANVAHDLTTQESEVLEDHVTATAEALRPMLQAEESVASYCNVVQKDASGLSPVDWDSVQVDAKRHFSFPSFVLDKSQIANDAQGRHLYVPYYVEIPPNPMDISGNELGHPITIACKMRSRESVLKTFGVTSTAAEVNCADLNKKVMERVYDLLAPDQKLRFDASGSSVEYRTMSVGTGVQWIAKSFAIRKTKDTRHWVFALPELKTSVNSKPELFAGAHYCKLIAPERAVQWYTRDALLP